MAYPTSDRLIDILDFKRKDPAKDELDLESLCSHLANSFEMNAPLARSLLVASGKMNIPALFLHIGKLIREDSAVRDVQTTGHLAKLLSRLYLVEKSDDYKIIGLPHRLFDQRSQNEREEYFRANHSLPASVSIHASQAKSMLEWEHKLITKYGIV